MHACTVLSQEDSLTPVGRSMSTQQTLWWLPSSGKHCAVSWQRERQRERETAYHGENTDQPYTQSFISQSIRSWSGITRTRLSRSRVPHVLRVAAGGNTPPAITSTTVTTHLLLGPAMAHGGFLGFVFRNANANCLAREVGWSVTVTDRSRILSSDPDDVVSSVVHDLPPPCAAK